MPIPDFQTLMLSVLKHIGNTGDTRVLDLRESLAPEFGLTEAEKAEMLPSKRQGVFHNRIAWALSYMKQARLIDSRGRSTYAITDRGKELLVDPPERLTITYLMRYPEFAAYRTKKRSSAGDGPEVSASASEQFVDEQTPDELIAEAYENLNQALARELLAQMSAMDPYRFEQLVVDVLVAMGYGGNIENAGQVTPKSGDEGIDGVINQDKLGLDVVYVQAKRWTKTIGRPDIQSFVGALAGKQANKGIFITTSDFSSGAMQFAQTVPQKVVLIDGERLAQLMIEHDVGVATQMIYRVKKIDTDYFEG